jgi:hypothetical protein
MSSIHHVIVLFLQIIFIVYNRHASKIYVRGTYINCAMYKIEKKIMVSNHPYETHKINSFLFY